ncbi:hypothetical protein [Bacillus pseudomycoides]|uniref:Uncharacterized protein n=1 Tax=Bacillus pseudomycoides TaxID=64104 RepID=A0A2C3Q6P8_9BACI|nr:hypothetical protein [Bacillus pseudomycoides]PDY46367.1 hypothetical protein CON79_15360 [Bacillus pseudomycoides]PEA80572.1 hypothetical protein CON99_27550 [Bacillus pseudomycoides]PED05764.1 hypothetical protein COO19_24780 [Bacillus pseudomycoides]PED73684.1 hypothetical protein CON97_01220 [Bacillus pseudomycoides]PEI38759.1 hypothetical protein CN620_21315 [Bacillus pseudomycoides]
MELAYSIFHILLTSLIQLFSLIGIIILVGFVLGYLESLTRTYWMRAFGRKGFLLTAWIGVPIHEFGHAFMCLLFRHQIIAIQLFPTNTNNGYLGYVRHQYNQRSIYQRIGNFFIGIAPIFSGMITLVISMYYFVPQSYSLFINALKTNAQAASINIDTLQNIFLSSMLLLKSLFTVSNLFNPLFWLFLFIAICISTHIALSKPDIEGSLDGIITMFILLFLFNSIARLFHYDSNQLIGNVVKYNTYLLAFSSIAILFSCIAVFISFICYKIKTASSK